MPRGCGRPRSGTEAVRPGSRCAGGGRLRLVALVAGPLASRPEPVTLVAQDAQPPVLLVPGYGGSTTALEVLAGALAGEGRDVVVVTPRSATTRGTSTSRPEALDDVVADALERRRGRTGWTWSATPRAA